MSDSLFSSSADFRDSSVRDAKFSEMLSHGEFPWEQITSIDVPALTRGRAFLVGLMDRYLAGLMAPYRPYAESLRHVLTRIEGHLVSGYRDGGDAPDKHLSLVDGFETPFGLELLATVHWVATREDAHDLDAVISAVHAWAPRKRTFQPEQMAITLDRLNAGGWLARPAP